MFKAKLYVSYKDGILDPAGQTTGSALHSLGYKNTSNVSVGKYITLDIDAESEENAKEELKEMADKLLTNPIIEKYTLELE